MMATKVRGKTSSAPAQAPSGGVEGQLTFAFHINDGIDHVYNEKTADPIKLIVKRAGEIRSMVTQASVQSRTDDKRDALRRATRLIASLGLAIDAFLIESAEMAGPTTYVGGSGGGR